MSVYAMSLSSRPPRQSTRTIKKAEPFEYYFLTEQHFVLWLRNSEREKYTKREPVDGAQACDWALAREAKKIKDEYESFLSAAFPSLSDEYRSDEELESGEICRKRWKKDKELTLGLM